jgi:RNA 2',3'-cyclic 3'-phosphodiesterase
VAVRPPDSVLEAVARAVDAGRPVRDGLRWEPSDHWHVTLQFLGPLARVAPVVGALATAAVRLRPFPFRFGGAGAFPTAKRARVVWIGAAEGHREMVDLAGAVTTALGPVGYERDGRAFRPHLTLARLKVPGDVGSVLAAIGPGPVGAAFTVGELVVYESRLSPQGSSYTVLERVPLRNA